MEAVDHQTFLGWSLRGYKPEQVARRLEGFMIREKYLSLQNLARAVAEQPEVAKRLKSYVTVHVSEFFRDGSYWARLALALAGMKEPAGSRLKAWSAGCSWGAEPATFWLMVQGLGQSWEIWATDTDWPTLEMAQTLKFPAQSWNAAIEPYRHLVQVNGAGDFSLAPAARNDIHFARHDLIQQGGYADNFDVVLCRHVLIYFSPTAKTAALEHLAGSLKEGGYFFLGATETLLDAEKYGLRSIAPAIFQKQG